MEDKKPVRRIVLPEKKTKTDIQVSELSTNPESIVNDGLQIAAIELARYRALVGRGHTLDLKQSRIITSWLKALTDLMKEQREQERAANFDKFSDEELALLAKKVLQNGGSVVEVDPNHQEGGDEHDDDDQQTS